MQELIIQEFAFLFGIFLLCISLVIQANNALILRQFRAIMGRDYDGRLPWNTLGWTVAGLGWLAAWYASRGVI